MILTTKDNEIYIIPRTLQDDFIFKKIDCSDMDEIYLKHVVYNVAEHSDLRIDSNSYNHYFFHKNDRSVFFEERKQNKKLIESYDNKYRNESYKYTRLYRYLEERDRYIWVNYRLLHTGISFIDYLIAKETVYQILYSLLKHENCEWKIRYFHIGSGEIEELDNLFNSFNDNYNSIDNIRKNLYMKADENGRH